ncbi:hypothetical protein DQE82_25340 [Micromonospora sp. LHW51205]|uniref:5-methylcytosine restriction system specificity protein McrC n=1 Tax=Micromonospora sp. LHW51205 TaxID=2248752 RepID=UPI000DE82B82|nr:hypothetical protein [Micromonospora sp. LHW51205]RBQ05648.1 hypothetical protein DQE82_25340 [Micromonospora sp. LHW51205]
MLHLREYKVSRVALTEREAGELGRLTRGSAARRDEPRIIQQILPSGEPGLYDVQPGPYVGRFTLGSLRTVDIASRFPFADLRELLQLATRPPVLLRDTAAAGSAGRGLVDLIATAFARETERLVGFGLAKEYQARTFTRSPYPGSPDVTTHLAKYLGRPDRLVTKAKRLTQDIQLNQTIAAAHRVLLQQHYPDQALSARLRALSPCLASISQVADPQRLMQRRPTFIPSRYQNAYALALLVLAGQTVLPTAAGASGVTVLFNMTKVWETYVGHWLANQLPAGHRISAQHPVALTDDPQPMTAYADFVILDEQHKPVAVYDAKYRHWQAKPKADELYQLSTYARRLHVQRAALLYPGHEGQGSHVTVGDLWIATIGVPVLSSALAAAQTHGG